MSRRLARETALQVLFQIDMTKANVEEAIESTMEQLVIRDDILPFLRQLVTGTIEYQEKVDEIITKLSRDWNLDRMATVDRNILRMALYELLYRDDIPKSVSVNEAIELAKIFGSEESSKFINGILGNVIENIAQYRSGVLK